MSLRIDIFVVLLENTQKIPSPKTKKDFGVINHFKGTVNEMVSWSEKIKIL